MAPYLLPLTNTLMTCSVYATVTVAINRNLEMSKDGEFMEKFKSFKVANDGRQQTLVVLIFSAIINISRWFEHTYDFEYNLAPIDNITKEMDRSAIVFTEGPKNSTLTFLNSSSVTIKVT